MTSNRIILENARTDGVADKSYWDAASSAQIEGFATDMSVNAGNTIDFKINLDGGAGGDYKVEIFRLGYYGGSGAREVTEWTNTNGVDQALPLYNADLGLVDAGNWTVTDSWNIPADAVSGVYIARLQMLDSNGNAIPGQTNQIPFIVRNDGVEADIVLQTSDTTWQAYNGWTGGLGDGSGGTSLYGDDAGLVNHDPIPGGVTSPYADRAYAVSYNRPITTRDGSGPHAGAQDYLFGADYAAIYFLEQQGYDVSYISGVDTDRLGADYLQNYKAFISVGHDEYWSGNQRSNVEDARDAGVNVLFWSGNEVYWKTRWETSISADGTEYRTLVCYKETLAVADPDAGPADYYDLDPTNIWTGTWRDMRFVGATDANGNYISGGLPETITGMISDCACVETMLTGQLFGPDGTGEFGGALKIPEAFANLRFWRDTNVPNTGELGIAPGIIGYEWDTSPTDDTRPAGLIRLSETTLDWGSIVVDQGLNGPPGTATHNLSIYRDPNSGALVFGAGTVFWSWGLSDMHDSSPYGANIQNTDLKQFTINMFADMGIQPAVTDLFLATQGLVRAIGSMDSVGATTTIADLPDSVTAFQTIQIAGTAADFNGTATTTDDGRVAAVEVSVDNGVTWRIANGTTNWSYSWTPTTAGSYTIKARAIDDSLNITNLITSQDIVTVTTPVLPAVVNMFGSSTPPSDTVMYNDNLQVELGVKFSVDRDGMITGLRYYRAAADANDTDTRDGHLWSSTGQLLGTVTFVSTPGQSGWQTASFSSPIALVAGSQYTASYRSADNYLSAASFFAPSNEVAFDGLDDDAFSDPFGVVSAPQSAVFAGATTNGNGVYVYGNSLVVPTETWNASNYFVDVLFQPQNGQNTAPVITSGNYTIPENGAAVGSVTVTDAENNSITYAIAGGVDAARFTINATTGALAFVSAPNYEAPTDVGANNVYDIIVSASDGIAATTKAVTVTVTDVNESANTAPTITSGNYTIAENTTAVGAVTATDAQSNPITYAISGGVDAAKFTINASTGALAFVTAPNYEAPTDTGANNVYDLIVSASDGIAAPTTKAVTVTVTDVAEAASNLYAAGTTPGSFASNAVDSTNYELGTRFTATQAGQITALQYYRGSADSDDTDVRALSLWTAAGVKLGSVTVTSTAGASGWQVGALSAPISIVAGQTYVVSYSYGFDNGQGATETYAYQWNYFQTERTSADGLLVTPANAGVYAVGPGIFPTTTSQASSYFVDVFFQPQNAAAPIVLDLGGAGLDLSSSVSFDFDGDGQLETGSWISSGNAFLALDRNGNSSIDGISEISFLSDLPGAKTDLEGLNAFDTNGDGVLSSDDDRFGDFLVWEDLNQDGISQTTELRSLVESGIKSVDLSGHEPSYTDNAGNIIHGSTEVTLTSGEMIKAFDVSLNYAEIMQPDATQNGAAGQDATQDTIVSLPYGSPVIEDVNAGQTWQNLVGLDGHQAAIDRLAARFEAVGDVFDLGDGHAGMQVAYTSAIHVLAHELDRLL